MFSRNFLQTRSSPCVNNLLRNVRIGTRNTSSLNTEKRVVKRSLTKTALITIGLSGGLAFSYYELALDAKEKRRVRVNVESIGRAIRYN